MVQHVERPKTVEEQFRSDLESAAVVVKILGSYCETIEELEKSVLLALKNDTHMKLVMRLLAEQQPTDDNE